MRYAAALLAVLLPFGLANASNHVQNVELEDFGTRTPIVFTNARLVRGDDLLRIRVSTTGLIPGNVYILLAYLYQDPSFCTNAPCEWTLPNSDIARFGGDPRVNATVVYLTGGRADSSGNGEFAGKIERGALGLINRQVLEGNGIYNMFGADVQVTLLDMGPPEGMGVDGFEQLKNVFVCGQANCPEVQIATFDADG